jgi:FkbM family methyltransferase
VSRRGVRTRLLGSPTARKAYAYARRIPFLGSVIQWVARDALLLGKPQWVQVPRGPSEGMWMFVDPRYELGYIRGDYDPWLEAMLKQLLSPGKTFLDVGAHIGYFSLCAATFVGPQGTVISLEPDPDNFSRLVENVHRNRLRSVIHPKRIAASATNGEGAFRRAHMLSSRVEGALIRGREAEGDSILVTTCTVDELLSGVEQGLIKVDVEGGEVEVLRGAALTLARASFWWLIEIHNPAARQEVPKVLREAGYRVELVRPSHPIYHQYRQEYAVARPLGTSTT